MEECSSEEELLLLLALVEDENNTGKRFVTDNGLLQYWVCQHKAKSNPLSSKKKRYQICSAVIHTLEKDGHLSIKKEATNHTCKLVSAMQRQKEHVRNEVRKIASSSTEIPSVIIQKLKTTKTLGELEYMPTDSALTRSIQRVKKQKQPHEPVELHADIVLEDMKKTLSGDVFFRKSIIQDGCHSFVFATDQDLLSLEQSPFWIMDGTYQTVPNIPYQLFRIHGRIGRNDEDSVIVPLVYVLMDSKQQTAYEDVFSYISSQMVEIEAKYFITDFEIAVINALKLIFPEIPPSGCYFHLKQSIFRNLKSCGLHSIYEKNTTFAKHVEMLVAMTFLAPEEITCAYSRLNIQILELFPELPGLTEFLDYISINYINGRPRGVPKNGIQMYIPPRFPPELWSVVERTNLGFLRTQDNVESSSHRWKNLLGQTHVGVHRCIKELRNEQHQVSLKIQNGWLSCFVIPAKRKQNIERENSLKQFLTEHSGMNILAFLESLANRLQNAKREDV